jgi:hypothetical protein
MVERGPYVSYAHCGLPYHVGGVIENESSLLVADANTFRSQFAVDVSRYASDRSAAGCAVPDAVTRHAAGKKGGEGSEIWFNSSLRNQIRS